MALILAFTLLTTLCWGVYGPLLDSGRGNMQSSLRPFICVGLAYCAIAVAVPLVLLRLKPEPGSWTVMGSVWSLLAGAAGALGALGVILAFHYGGTPLYVMPLIFGGAPVVNTIFTMVLGRIYKQANPIFYAGLIVVITGAVTVLVFRPAHAPPARPAPAASEDKPAAEASDSEQPKHVAAAPAHETKALEALEWAAVIGSVLMAAFCWGVYGPVLHKGQMAMAGSRLRPFICVGLAYFLIAVLVPLALLALWKDPGNFNTAGILWSLAGGTAGAIGALGVIMAFTFGGKPSYVMPIVFGGAPVINALVSMARAGTFNEASAAFYAGMMLVIGGAVTVLVFAPRGHAPAKKA